MQNGRNMITKPKTPAQRIARVTTTAVFFTAAVMLVGCSRAPSFNILGSFFPSWILCGVIGILLAVASRLFFVRVKLEAQLKPLILVYPCLALFFTFTLWLLFFS
jgi:YtcA family